MSTPIKTGAIVLIEQRLEYYRCDLYEYYDTVLIARCNPLSVTREIENSDGLWATMHDYDDRWTGDTDVFVSTNYTIHYMMQFMGGSWHNVKLT